MTTFGAQWDQNQNKPLYRFNNKQTKIKLWQYKVCVCERVVNEKEFRQIGITQRFERLGWERTLDWCEVVTRRVYLKAVTNWYSLLRLENEDEHPSQWRLVGDTGKGSMTMSFETMNQIGDFDFLGVDNYFYYSTNTF
ncbi:hypothetical protein HanRHA438_Chr15g0717401 [Helianthus annuus]|uniref:Uncharacterized protein n=1 Tax=Helianthus annuus TaxID=4232 RepID=A0A9K3H320_HELAN|nr:hypothetical protein HanXRQr2_Chr15g0705221 [Helianthus annuus]KAJ0456833.1 hypothetical protein HanIR_Chr15g0766951 [Helianthus annuus]KAJ0653342.1 hypothetical protein HanOQP8_Chr15g0582451 [Helianthus annuus]KAJ0832265.1 hypothetical protein HanPSC8_Chr15g0676781 [Helianthus annuus]KAJ0845771.1 hypothetical protein HanRHA438_Chr15g0717401 [Helianthus annuus]